MAKRSWPFGVTSWDDTVKFAQLLFGVDVAFENYAERLPHRSNKSFLLFAKGACAEGRPFFEIGDFIAPQLEEIQQWEENVRNNNARPTKSQQMLQADGWTVYYWSAQVTRAPCLCRFIFGADAHQKHVPTSSAMWKAGSRFEKLWDATLMKNYEAFQNRDLRPTWLDKSWQVLWNWNDHNKNHGISPHSDESATYSNVDPITSFSFGHGGVLTLGPKKGPVTRMLFQEGGDALVMAGDFQAEFCHGVPARSTWKDLKLLPMFTTVQEWEKVGLQQEIALHEGAAPEAKHVRMNCTLRWHSTHWDGMLRTAYSAQGLTLDGGVLVDLRRGGGLEDADWWLAIYVMLTRARKLKNLILLGFTEQVEELLRRGPPTYLRELTDKLETKAASTLERLQSWPVYDALQAS